MIEIGVPVFEGGVDAAAESLGEGPIVDEELFLGGMMEGVVFGVEGDAGYDEMDVGVVLDLAAPGVEDAGETESRAVVLGGADVLEGGGALFEKDRIEDLGMEKAEGAEFLRQGEGDHEVGHGQEPGFLFGGPDLLVEGTTLRAGAVVATVVGVLLFLAAFALIETATELGRAAREDAPHGPVMVVGELVPMGLGVGFPMLGEEICEVQGHGMRCWRGRVALAVRKGGEGFAAFALADLGEVKVGHHFLERAVTKVSGDLSNRRSAFKHVGAEAVTQGVGAEAVVLFG